MLLLCWFDLSEQSTHKKISWHIIFYYSHKHSLKTIISTFLLYSFCCVILYRIAIVIGTPLPRIHLVFCCLFFFFKTREVNKIARHQYILVYLIEYLFFLLFCFVVLLSLSLVSCYCVTFSQWAFFKWTKADIDYGMAWYVCSVCKVFEVFCHVSLNEWTSLNASVWQYYIAYACAHRSLNSFIPSLLLLL